MFLDFTFCGICGSAMSDYVIFRLNLSLSPCIEFKFGVSPTSRRHFGFLVAFNVVFPVHFGLTWSSVPNPSHTHWIPQKVLVCG